MGSSFWHSGGCYPPLQNPRYSAWSLVKEKMEEQSFTKSV